MYIILLVFTWWNLSLKTKQANNGHQYTDNWVIVLQPCQPVRSEVQDAESALS